MRCSMCVDVLPIAVVPCLCRPEALGIVSGTVFLMCTIFSQLAFAENFEQVPAHETLSYSAHTWCLFLLP